ncbi:MULTISPECIES: hypothetical protein [unclassified Nocardiopsis]|uniref:hypothetical protein n=1 Tax=unclassified Nocardiopsis TaxID=2649073 RepID=UPI0013577E2C|nr:MULTISPECIES: hypothetical protein [unclassified Nocardiopsis]
MDEPTPRSLKGDLDDIARQVFDLDSAVDKAVDRLDDLERHRDFELPERLDTIESIAEEARDELAETLKEIRAMRSHVRWLERALAQTADLCQAHLDASDSAIEKLVARIEQGRALEAQVAQRDELARLQWLIDRPDQLTADLDALTDQASALSRQLQDMTPEHADYRARVTAFSALTHKIKAAQQAVEQAQQRAKKARQAKHQKVSANSAVGPDILDGQHARTQLTRILRTRVSVAVAEVHRLPEWFTRALGHEPPRQGVEEWMSTAAAVIAHRLLRGIDDPVSALGSSPRYDDLFYSEHFDLQQRIADLPQ